MSHWTRTSANEKKASLSLSLPLCEPAYCSRLQAFISQCLIGTISGLSQKPNIPIPNNATGRAIKLEVFSLVLHSFGTVILLKTVVQQYLLTFFIKNKMGCNTSKSTTVVESAQTPGEQTQAEEKNEDPSAEAPADVIQNASVKDGACDGTS